MYNYRFLENSFAPVYFPSLRIACIINRLVNAINFLLTGQ